MLSQKNKFFTKNSGKPIYLIKLKIIIKIKPVRKFLNVKNLNKFHLGFLGGFGPSPPVVVIGTILLLDKRTGLVNSELLKL
jgi:hypothetical protein